MMYTFVCFFFIFFSSHHTRLLSTTENENYPSTHNSEPRITPLHLAIQYNHQDTACAFLYLGERTLNVQDFLGNTPLHYAVKKKSPSLCHLLLRYNARSDINNNKGYNACALLNKYILSDPSNTLYLRMKNIFYAFSQKTTEEINDFSALCYKGATAAIKELLSTIEKTNENDPNDAIYHLLHTYDSFGETALTNAIMSQNIATIALLLKAGADPNLPNQRGTTPLIKATKQNTVEIISLLLVEKNIALEEKNLKGYSALHCAVINKNKEIVRLLLQVGANPQTTSNNMAPLHQAALFPSTEIAQLLIDAKASPNQPGPHKNNPIHLAAAYNNTPFIELLIQNGASCNAQNYQKETALMIAARHENIEILNLLLATGAAIQLVDKKKNSVLHHAAIKKNVHILQNLLTSIQTNENKHFLLNMQNESGNTALHLATYYNNFKAVKRLIHAGIDVNIQNQHGDSALHQAIKNKAPFLIAYLINAGSDLTLKNEEGDTPLEYAHYQLHSLHMLIAFGSLDTIQKQKCLDQIETLKKIIVLLKEKIPEPLNTLPEMLITPISHESTVLFEPVILNDFTWRGRDSNPRCFLQHSRFRDGRFQPLSHLSKMS
jgi:serine/threonine-protein phosphatase 6 regulatory ankyrin repeat subunit B